MNHYLDWARQGQSRAWRYLAAIGLVLFLWIALPIPIYIVFSVFGLSDQFADLLKEYSFVPAFFALPIVVAWVLRRPGWSVALPSWPPIIAMYLWGIVIGLVVIALSTILAVPLLEIRFQGFDALVSAGLGFVLLSLLGLAIQTAFEELLFRGLITQFAFSLTGSLVFSILVQALVFGAIHITNIASYQGSIWAMVPYTMTAIAWGWVAWRTGSLLVPAGLHFANNFGDVLLVGTEGDIIGTVAPVVTEMPTLPIISLLSLASALLTLVAVEALMRYRSNDPIGQAAPVRSQGLDGI